ncbi:MAG: hypothetical protein K9K93_03085 [Acholeplasmataceae bacterium]|nr:hypothetical protein [Acholeplasmataceae bacterium]
MHDALKGFVKRLPDDQSSSHSARARSAFDMLSYVDLMLDAFFDHKQDDQGTLMLDVFGFLQALFVGIDALYDLSIGLTSYKYHVNVNKNDTLRELKFIRNDIVGHPTHRTYHDGGTGFSTVVSGAVSKTSLTYETYIYRKNRFDVERRSVDFLTLSNQYKIEKDQIIKDLLRYLEKKQETSGLSDLVFRVFETLNAGLLEEIVSTYQKTYGLDQHSKNRFLWRADLLKKAIFWKEHDPDKRAFVIYAAKKQAEKLYDILGDLESVKRESLYVSLPDCLSGFYRAMRRHEDEAYPLLANVHDRSHPLFRSDIESLKAYLQSKDSTLLLDWLLDLKDPDHVYLIGSILRMYRPRR